ncbi:hypothetical protein D5R81_15460 [Parashewanella spongiae]|uniref:Uncharacterized protein n=1 Tax=Parashewanella spongiae TaxID=342950 RepID=A0A3A6U339_9GAMM|nr:hypothetical protein [Parashewanella spongiae]MCL1079447.1 hypothetical protein [Parashewanella spongiae]RJY07559.1 hypothetical protein D5R81_15460 [Parashewanella spongiae]
MNTSVMKMSCLLLVLLLTHCSSASKPPHCHDDGKGLKPVNHAAISLKPVRLKPTALKPIKQHHE